MNKRHNKGVTLVEMIIVLAVTAIVMPLIFQLFMYGQETFTYTNKLIAQQYIVTNTMQHIRGDIQSAASVMVTPDVANPQIKTLRLGYYDSLTPTLSTYKYWRFYAASTSDEGKLQYGGEKAVGIDPVEADYADVVTGLDIVNCDFIRNLSLEPDKLIIKIQPKKTNTGRAQAKNVRETIITEISVQYKD